MSKRSKLTFAVGLAVLLAGGAAVFSSMRGGSQPSGGTERVLYAAKPIPAGTTGANAVGQGLVQGRAVQPGGKPANALADVSQLAGRSAAAPIEAGEILTADRFPPAQTRIGTVRIPPGKTALALQMANVPGVAGFAGAGDRIDVFGMSKETAKGPSARLILQGVEVLNVNGAALAPAQGQPSAPGLVFLLAVTPQEAERLVYLTTFEQLYFSLVPKDQPPVTPTAGAGPDDALKLP
jgi:Flp pilus assembly protein CpaB